MVGTFSYPGKAPPNADFASNWHQSTFSLVMGGCFTHQVAEPGPYSQSVTDFILLNMSDPFLGGGYSMFVFVHNRDLFVPSYGMGPELAGQTQIILT